MKYRLMIKTHNVTGLKYLCITTKDNWQEYTGSGVYWKRHLNVHGSDISTQLLYETKDFEQFNAVCLHYSNLYNVHLNEQWANLIPELGYNVGNFVSWWSYASEELKKETRAKIGKSISKNFRENPLTRLKISDSMKKFFENMNPEFREAYIQNMRAGWEDWYYNLTPEQKKSIADNNSKNVKCRFANMTETEYQEFCSEMTRRRLSLSPEKKELRKQRLLKTRSKKNYDHLWDKMSQERQGKDNPNADIVVWYGVEYGKNELFRKLKNEMGKAEIRRILADPDIPDCYVLKETPEQTYPAITCPHCGSTTTKKPNGFYRWHFDNCRSKEN